MVQQDRYSEFHLPFQQILGKFYIHLYCLKISMTSLQNVICAYCLLRHQIKFNLIDTCPNNSCQMDIHSTIPKSYFYDIANCALQSQSQMHKNTNLTKHNKQNSICKQEHNSEAKGYLTNTGILMIHLTVSYIYKNDLLEKPFPFIVPLKVKLNSSAKQAAWTFAKQTEILCLGTCMHAVKVMKLINDVC